MLKLNRNQIKYIAIIAMIIDHIAMFFIAKNSSYTFLYFCMRIVGRLTGPIMCFFISEGYRHTRSKFKYGLRLAIFALISQVPYSLAEYGEIFHPYFNMIATLFISFMILVSYEYIGKKFIKWLVIVLLIGLSLFTEWAIFAPIMVLFFYLIREKRMRIIGYSIITICMLASNIITFLINGTAWYSELWHIGMFLVIPIMLMYNGELGSKHPINKWLFYIIYPLHFLIIYFILK